MLALLWPHPPFTGNPQLFAEIADRPASSSRKFTTEHGHGQGIMNTHNLAMTTAGVVAVAACSLASATAWLLVTAPTTVAMAVQGGDMEPLAQIALHALYEAVARLVQYF
jgi:hypothetical protein